MSTNESPDANRRPESRSADERSFISHNLFTILAIALIFFVGSAVPQVRNLFELPTLGLRDSKLVMWFYAYVIALLIVYSVLGWWIVPVQIRRKRDDDSTGDGGRKGRLGDRVIARIGGRKKRWTFASLMLGGILFVGFLLVQDQWITPFGSPFLLTASLIVLGLFVVVLFWNRMDRRTQLLWLRILIVMFGLNLLGEFIWGLSLNWSFFSPRNYTLWAILHTAFCLLLFARVVDFWSSYSKWVRLVAVTLVLLVLGRMPTKQVGQPTQLVASGGIADLDDGEIPDDPNESEPASAEIKLDPWLIHLKNRLDAMPNDSRPVVLIAASGGGSRAALFTSLVYEYFDRTAIRVEGEDPYNVRDHVLLISSVSGGTLASACYVDQEYNARRLAEKGTRENPHNYIFDEIRDLLRNQKNLDDLQGIPWCNSELDRNTTSQRTYFELVNEVVASDDPKTLWFLQSMFADDMCTDFMAPLLRGALHMPIGRGQAMSRFWEHLYGLGGSNVDMWKMAAEADPSLPPILDQWPPLLLCNVSEVARGTRLIVGFPPLPPKLLESRSDSTRNARGWVNLDPKGDQFIELTLSEAVRLSANFPWGFPVASVSIDGVDDDVHLIDGGVVDNTGIDAIRSVVQRLYGWAQSEVVSGQCTTEEHDIARKIFDELNDRGILLIEVDSGAKPRKPGWVSSMFSGMLEPVSALENAAYANASSASAAHLHYLEDYLPSTDVNGLRQRLEELRSTIHDTSSDEPSEFGLIGEFYRVKKLTITCNHQDNVMTAWALGPKDKATIFLRFLAGSERLHDQIADYVQQHEYLVALEEFVRTQESIAKSDGGQIDTGNVQFAIERLKDLAFYAQAKQHKQDIELQLEKMFYQKIPLPDDSVEEIRLKLPQPNLSNKEFFPEKFSDIESMKKSTASKTKIAMPEADPSKGQFEAVEDVIRQYDSGLKGLKSKLRSDTSRIRGME